MSKRHGAEEYEPPEEGLFAEKKKPREWTAEDQLWGTPSDLKAYQDSQPREAPYANLFARKAARAEDKFDSKDGQTYSEELEPETYTAAVAARLQAHPGEWVDGLELARLGGAYAWRSRVSDARLQLGLDIENRQRRVGKRIVSEYRIRTAAEKNPETSLDPHGSADRI